MNLNSKKAQMEVFGLAIFVVVLVFAFLILLQLGLGSNKSPVNIKTAAKKNMIAGSFVDALLRTTTKCSKYSVEDLLDDALSYNKGSRLISCVDPDDPSNREDSLEYVKFIIKKSLTYFDEEGDYYTFEVYKNGQDNAHRINDLSFTSKNKECKSQNYETFPTKIQTFTGDNILITLKICLD